MQNKWQGSQKYFALNSLELTSFFEHWTFTGNLVSALGCAATQPFFFFFKGKSVSVWAVRRFEKKSAQPTSVTHKLTGYLRKSSYFPLCGCYAKNVRAEQWNVNLTVSPFLCLRSWPMILSLGGTARSRLHLITPQQVWLLDWRFSCSLWL